MYFIFLCCQHLWKSPFLNRARHKKLISRHRVVKHITDLAGSNNFIHRIWLFVTSKPNLSLLYSFISSWDLSPLCLSLSLSLSLWSKIYNLDMEVKIIPVTWNRKQHTHTHTLLQARDCIASNKWKFQEQRLSHKKEWKFAICHNMNGLGGYYSLVFINPIMINTLEGLSNLNFHNNSVS